jgi:hypothetical protein
MNVVFTGPAFDEIGKPINRADLIDACSKVGITVHKQFGITAQLLVASRIDTCKARAAALRGAALMTYPQFIERFLEGTPIEKKGPRNKYVDAFKAVKAYVPLPPLAEEYML